MASQKKPTSPAAQGVATPPFKSAMKASAQCVEFIASWESFSATPYKCSAGVWTIGYGHAMPKGITRSLISQESALKLLAEDIAKFEAGVNALLRVEVSQTEFDALVSLAFNIGLGVRDGVKGDFADSTLLEKLNAGDRVAASAQFPAWNKARNPRTGKLEEVKGLTRRRVSEQLLFTKGLYALNR